MTGRSTGIWQHWQCKRVAGLLLSIRMALRSFFLCCNFQRQSDNTITKYKTTNNLCSCFVLILMLTSSIRMTIGRCIQCPPSAHKLKSSQKYLARTFLIKSKSKNQNDWLQWDSSRMRCARLTNDSQMNDLPVRLEFLSLLTLNSFLTNALLPPMPHSIYQ